MSSSVLDQHIEKIRVDVHYENEGVRYDMPIMVRYNPDMQTVEEGLVNTLGGRGQSFEQLAAERGWNKAVWTYPSYSTGATPHVDEVEEDPAASVSI